jgi:chromosome segregation ATPase
MLFNLFKKKDSEEKKDAEDNEDSDDEDSNEETKENKPANSGTKNDTNVSGDLIKINTEIERIKVSVEGFAEVRKSFTERFSSISEQIGELRNMIFERDKNIQEIELKAIKAYDLLDSVHPEKIMSEVQKQDAKSEALKANLEGNEAIMDRIMEELKEAKKKIEFFRGVEEIIKLSEEVKSELIEIKKIESKIALNTDKVETIYAEMRKKYQDIDSFSSDLREMKVISEQNTKDIGYLKEKVAGFVSKDELEKLTNKVQKYIEALKGLEKESSLTKDISTLKTMLEGLK